MLWKHPCWLRQQWLQREALCPWANKRSGGKSWHHYTSINTEGSGSTPVLKSSFRKSGNLEVGFSLRHFFHLDFLWLNHSPQTHSPTLSLSLSLSHLLSAPPPCFPLFSSAGSECACVFSAAVMEAAVCAEWTGIHNVVKTCLLPLIYRNWAKLQHWQQLQYTKGCCSGGIILLPFPFKSGINAIN